MRFVKTQKDSGLPPDEVLMALGMNSMQGSPLNNTKHSILCFAFLQHLKGLDPGFDLKGPVAGAKMSPVHGGPFQLRIFPQLPGGHATGSLFSRSVWCLIFEAMRNKLFFGLELLEEIKIYATFKWLYTSEIILWAQETNPRMCIIWLPGKVWYFWDWESWNIFVRNVSFSSNHKHLRKHLIYCYYFVFTKKKNHLQDSFPLWEEKAVKQGLPSVHRGSAGVPGTTWNKPCLPMAVSVPQLLSTTVCSVLHPSGWKEQVVNPLPKPSYY